MKEIQIETKIFRKESSLFFHQVDYSFRRIKMFQNFREILYQGHKYIVNISHKKKYFLRSKSKWSFF